MRGWRPWGLVTALRGLRSRSAVSVLILAVAVLAVAGAAAGPTYYTAGQTSVLRDTVASVPVLGRGYEITESGPVSMSFDPISVAVVNDLGAAAPLFATPVDARIASALYAPTHESLALVSSTGLCAHLAVTGFCPTASGQIAVDRSLASLNGWRPGQTVHLDPWGPLTVTGIYSPPPAPGDYWFDQLPTYFPREYGAAAGARGGGGAVYDAVFTPESTLTGGPAGEQGSISVHAALDIAALRPGPAAGLPARIADLQQDAQLQGQQAVVTTTLPATIGDVRAAWRSLAVPVTIVTLELLAVAALLLWILVSDAASARGPEIALAKLRGQGRLRLAAFALGELAMLIVLAVPLGVLAGWGAAAAIGSGLLRPGTPVALPGLAWAAGAAAALGGLIAVAAGVRPTLRRPVMEQWRRSDRRPARPGWAFDAVVLTGAAAGLAEVYLGGSIGSAHQRPIAVLVPGLIGLAVAVVAARLLPVACGLAARRLRRTGPASFLALRQISRRPGGVRTTTVLATSFALAAFALSAWALARANYATAADADTGAPTVLDVTAPAADLASLVARADPTGRHATPVEEYDSNGTVTVAVDPAGWSRVALRGPSGPGRSELAALDPPEPAPLTLDGSQVRLDVTTSGFGPAGTSLVVDVLSPGGSGPTPVTLAPVPGDGTVRLTGDLPPCPCVLEDLTAEPPPTAYNGTNVHGTVTVTGVATGSGGRWAAVPGGLLGAEHWYAGTGPRDRVAAGATAGFTWSFADRAGSATLAYRDRPVALPAVTAAAVAGRTGPLAGTGLDGLGLPMRVVGTARTVPGAPSTGVLVDLAYAERAAEGNLDAAQTQVWIAGDPAPVENALRREGVAIGSVSTAAAERARLARSGPGLAGTLFLAEAAAAAALAAGTAVVALFLLARRRRYELAALMTVGVGRRRLVASVLAEQLVLVAFAALVGVGAGLASAAALLGAVPEFATAPVGVPLASFPPAVPVVPVIVAAFVVVLAAASAAAVRLVAGTELIQLREAPA